MNLTVATVSFAAIIAALIAMPTPVALPNQTAPATLAKTYPLPVPPAATPCAQQNWPNFDAACLRFTDGKQTIRSVRAVGDQG